MKKTLLLIAVTLISALTIKAQDMTLEEILESHFEAIGQEKLIAIKTVEFKGKILTQGMELPFTVKLPDGQFIGQQWGADNQPLVEPL